MSHSRDDVIIGTLTVLGVAAALALVVTQVMAWYL